MEKDNKIISFTKNRKKPEYRLKKQISIVSRTKKITYKVHDSYEISFTILYYEAHPKKSKYICIPQNLKKEKLAEYLYISTCIYETKKHGVLS